MAREQKRHTRKSITIKEVAALAEVSLATASRALSNRGYISAPAQLKVQEAAHKLGYKPSAAARSLKLQRTNTIGLMITDVKNPFYSYIADGVLTSATRLGYHVILCATAEDPVLEKEYLDVLMEKRVDGILAVPTGENQTLWLEARDLGAELVFVDREIHGLGADLILVDNAKGTDDAISYLIELGHRRIGFIGPSAVTTGKGRLQGYHSALERAGLPANRDLVQIASIEKDAGYQAAKKLLALPDRPTALFAGNNILAENALLAIKELKLNLPTDISFVMFDDVPWASIMNPTITTVSQPSRTLGVLGFELLVQRLQTQTQQDQARQQVILLPELIKRESCSPPGKMFA
jgi:LacI family transcriptional regulator